MTVSGRGDLHELGGADACSEFGDSRFVQRAALALQRLGERAIGREEIDVLKRRWVGSGIAGFQRCAGPQWHCGKESLAASIRMRLHCARRTGMPGVSISSKTMPFCPSMYVRSWKALTRRTYSTATTSCSPTCS